MGRTHRPFDEDGTASSARATAVRSFSPPSISYVWRGSTRQYVETELYEDSCYEFPVTYHSSEQLLRFSVEHVGRIAPRPLFLAHGADNDLYRPAESERLYELAGEPRELHLLEGAGHSEWMHEHETFRHLVDLIDGFIRRSLAERAGR